MITYGPNADASMKHLRDDAPYQLCDRCGRKSWAAVRFTLCGMPQPDGSRCTGTFREAEEA